MKLVYTLKYVQTDNMAVRFLRNTILCGIVLYKRSKINTTNKLGFHKLIKHIGFITMGNDTLTFENTFVLNCAVKKKIISTYNI